MGDEFAMEGTLHLDHPLTEEQFDSLIDVDFDDTSEVWFHTKHGKEVHFVKKQELIKPKTDDAWPSPIKVCGACGTCLFNIGGYKAKFCSECGRAVKWDD